MCVEHPWDFFLITCVVKFAIQMFAWQMYYWIYIVFASNQQNKQRWNTSKKSQSNLRNGHHVKVWLICYSN
jgi:hypothetical protein